MKLRRSRPTLRAIPAAALALLALPLLAFEGPPAAQEATATATADEQIALREKFLALAELYTTFEWTAGEENVFHGESPGGVWVDTPDDSFEGGAGMPTAA